MRLSDAVRHFGSHNKLAIALGIHRQAITKWVKGGIPELRQYQLELMTGGKLKRERRAQKRGSNGARS